jgi:hypothetical protein
MSPQELCQRSELVVVGEVTTLETQWSEGSQGGLETHAFLAVEKTLRGPPVIDIEVVTRGGQIGDVRQWVEDAAVFQTDTRYVLHLVRAGQAYRVVGGELGAALLLADREAVEVCSGR